MAAAPPKLPAKPERTMYHIDRKELYTNLETRVHYLQSFVDWDNRDVEALISGAKYIKALIPAVVNIIYQKLCQYDITARAFTTRSTSYEGPVDEIPGEASPQVIHRKAFMRAYLAKLCSDPRDMEFWEYLDKVGMMHVGLGRTHPLSVEYVHIGAALCVIQDVLTEATLSHPRLPMPRKIAMVKALGKLLWIQNDLFAKWYVTDGDEFTDGVDFSGLLEKEGFLHGKEVLSTEEEEEGKEEAAKDAAEGEAAAAAAKKGRDYEQRPEAGAVVDGDVSSSEQPALDADGSSVPSAQGGQKERRTLTSPKKVDFATTLGVCPFSKVEKGIEKLKVSGGQ